jgi:hypothetical protein
MDGSQSRRHVYYRKKSSIILLGIVLCPSRSLKHHGFTIEGVEATMHQFIADTKYKECLTSTSLIYPFIFMQQVQYLVISP